MTMTIEDWLRRVDEINRIADILEPIIREAFPKMKKEKGRFWAESFAVSEVTREYEDFRPLRGKEDWLQIVDLREKLWTYIIAHKELAARLQDMRLHMRGTGIDPKILGAIVGAGQPAWQLWQSIDTLRIDGRKLRETRTAKRDLRAMFFLETAQYLWQEQKGKRGTRSNTLFVCFAQDLFDALQVGTEVESAYRALERARDQRDPKPAES